MAPDEVFTLDPDASVAGLMGRKAAALRYADTFDCDPHESPGIIRSFMPENARVLDVGCGAGGYTLAINQGKHNSVVCIEPDAERAAAATLKGLNVHQTILDDEFVKSQSKFDVVVLGDVLEHVVDPANFLRVAKETLAPNGKIIVSVPNIAHWSIRLRLLFGRFNYTDFGIMDSTHLRWFTEKTLIQLMKYSGFEIKAVKRSAGIWLPDYQRFPFRLIPTPMRKSAIVFLITVFPRLFGAQHVIFAQAAQNNE